MSGFTPWVWSPEHGRHYTWRHNEEGTVEYQWSGPALRTSVEQTQAPPIPLAASSYSYAGTSVPRSIPSQGVPVRQEEEEEQYTQSVSVQYTQSVPVQHTQSVPVQHTQGIPVQHTQSIPVQHTQGYMEDQQKIRHIRTGIDGREDEYLDPRYRRVSQRSQAQFFCYGRVFMMLWTEPAGRDNPGLTRGSTHFSVVKYSETVYSEIRRFIVVCNKGAFSQCIPIQTYRGQGATRVGILLEDHAVIYTGGEYDAPPALLEGEHITKQALRVVADGSEVLDVCSRINFGKTYTVEHNVKVLSIGILAPEHNHLLRCYWQLAHDPYGWRPAPNQSLLSPPKQAPLPTPKQSTPPVTKELDPDTIMDAASQALPHCNDNAVDITHLLDPESYFAGLEDLEAKVAMSCDLFNVKSSWIEADTLQQPVDPTIWGESFAKIVSAFELLQESGFTATHFTILVQCPDRFNVAIAVPIPLEMLQSLAWNCRTVSNLCVQSVAWSEETEEHCYECLAELEKDSTKMLSHLSMLPINQETTIPLSAMDGVKYLPKKAKLCILQMQSTLNRLYRALSLGLVSYTGSHACDFGLSVFKRERATFLIDGHYTFGRRTLGCLKDFIGSTVWILGPPPSTDTCYLVSIAPEDFVDLWGPLWAIPTDAADGGFYKLRTQDGEIHAATQLEPTIIELKSDETMCHWVKSDDNYSTLGSSHYENRHLEGGVAVMPPIIPQQRRLLIGASFIWNRDCEKDIAAVQKLIANDLRFPGVSRGRYEPEGYQINASGGYFITTTITKTWKRIPPTTHKSRLIAHCKNPLNCPLPVAILQLRVGLEVSVCTGNAQRVTLWNIMKLLHMQNAGSTSYQECGHPIGEPTCVTTCWNKLSAGNSACIPLDPGILPNDVIVSALLKLEATGVDAAGRLQAWWPFTDSPYTLELEVASSETTHKWIPFLKDSRDVSTFAIMSARCFEYCGRDRLSNTSVSRKCSDRSKSQSINTAKECTRTLLHTLIQLHPASKVPQIDLEASLQPFPSKISLPVGACLRLGEVGSLEIVNRGDPQLTLLKNGLMATLSEGATWIASGDRGHKHKELIDDETHTGKTLSVVIM